MALGSKLETQEQERTPVVVYGGDITALCKLVGLYTRNSRLNEQCSPRIAEARKESCLALAQKIGLSGLKPLEDNGWEIFSVQVKAVEAGTTDLPTQTLLLDPEEQALHGLARELRATGPIKTNEHIVADFDRPA